MIRFYLVKRILEKRSVLYVTKIWLYIKRALNDILSRALLFKLRRKSTRKSTAF
jgi:hypothetical protein